MPIKFALFDLDDTVHDKTTSLIKCAEFIFHKFLSSSNVNAIEFTESFVYENTVLQPKAQVFENLANQFSVEADLQAAMLEYFDQSFHLFATPFSGVNGTMKFLKDQKITVGCVTNGRDFFQRNKITALGLNEYFDVIVTSGELSVKKPSPVIFKAALEKLGALESQCAFIGDSLTADMQPAKKLGMKTIWVNRSGDSQPDYVDFALKSFSEFEGIWQKVCQ